MNYLTSPLQEEIDHAACHRELKRLWDKYGLGSLSASLAALITADARQVEESGRFPAEVEVKDHTAETLRNFACYLMQATNVSTAEEKEVPANVVKAIKHLAADRDAKRPGMRLLDHAYGPQAIILRCQVLGELASQHWQKISRKEAAWGKFRTAMLNAVGAKGNCIAEEDAHFERLAAAILKS